MAVMAATTVVRLRKSSFCLTTSGIVIIFCSRATPPSGRINVDSAKLFATFPAPGAPTTGPDHKVALALQTTCKNVVAGCIFESPSITPGALFSVIARHLTGWNRKC
jgi:hypothetical protein